MPRFAILIVVLFLVCALAPGAVDALEPKTHTITLSPEAGYYDFKETAMEENGFLYGLSGSYTYRGESWVEQFSKVMLKVDGRIIFGRVDFNGYLYDDRYYEIQDVKNFISEFRGLVGYDFSIFSDTTITPFAGIGYRYLKDQLQKVNAGYRRVSEYLYTPLGFETNTPLAKGWSAGVKAEYDFFWSGKQTTYLSDLDPLFGDVDNDQDSGYGFKISIQIRKEMSDKNYIFEPYVDYWSIDSSEVKPVFHTGVQAAKSQQEFENTSIIVGMKVGVEF